MSTDRHEDHELMTVAQMAEKLNISRPSAYRMVRERKVKSLNFGVQLTRVPREEVERLLRGAVVREVGALSDDEL